MSDDRVPFSNALYGAFQFTLVLCSISGTPKIARCTLLSIVIWIAHYLITKTTTGNPAVDLAQGSAIITQLLTPIDLIFFTDPNSLRDLYRGHTNTNGNVGRITDAPLRERVKWTWNFFNNARGIGWAHESPHTPARPPQGTSRLSFVFSRLGHGILCVLLECVLYVLNASNPAMTSLDGTAFTKAPLFWRALGTLGFGGAGFARINWMNCFLSATVVGLGFSAPERWPNLFGSLLEAWSVERFWGRVWHHLLRKPLSAIASFIVSKIFRLPPNQTSTSKSSASVPARKLLWLFVVFLTSGTVHIAGERMLLGRIGYGAFTFFVLQPFGIVFETLVKFVWTSYITPGSLTTAKSHRAVDTKKTDSDATTDGFTNTVKNTARQKVWIRCIGHLWVASWFVWTLPYMIEPMVPTGMFIDPRVDMKWVDWILCQLYVYLSKM